MKQVKARFGGVMTDGQGEMKGQIFRIAHIGYLDYMDAVALVAALEQVLIELTPGKFALGDGLRAAQQCYADWMAGKAAAQCACGRATADCVAGEQR